MPNTQPTIDKKEHDSNRSAKRVVSVDAFGGIITDGNYITMVDEVDTDTTYLGLAQIGTATSASSWQIKKIYTSGTITSITYANGTDAFTGKWDDRLTYTYS